MIKLPFILVATAIMGIFSAQALPIPEDFSKLHPVALVTLIALAVLYFAYKLICVQQRAMIHTMVSSIKEANQPMKDAITPLVELSKKIERMPCLHEGTLKEIFKPTKQEKIT